MVMIETTVETVSAADTDPIARSYFAAKTKAFAPTGMAANATPTEHEFYAAGEGLGLRIRTIRGTGGDGATASTALDVDLYWEEP